MNTSPDIFKRVIRRITKWYTDGHDYFRIIGELEDLTDHQLKDIGLRRADISRVARRTVYMR